MRRIVLLALLVVAAPLLAAPADDAIVAERGADRITLGQARAIVGGLDAEQRKKLAGTAAVSDLLRNLLLQRAVLAQALAQHWDQRPDVAAAAQRARDAAVGQSFLAAQASVPAGYPSEADIQAAYEQNKPRLMQPRAYHLAQAFLAAPPPEQPAARRRLADLARQAARARGGLQAVAAQMAGVQYLDLGWLAEAQIQPAVRATVSGLQEGALCDPVCTQNGCHVIRLVATRPAGPAPLADVRDTLVQALRQQKQQDGERAYANLLLRREPVKINEIELSRVAP